MDELKQDAQYPKEIEEQIPYLFTREQVAEFFQISTVQLRRLEKEYGLKHVKAGRKMKRYCLPDLKDFVEKHSAEIFDEEEEISDIADTNSVFANSEE